MGMYTELHLFVTLKSGKDNLYDFLEKWVTLDKEEIKPFDDHKFFGLPRWEFLPHICSMYFQFNSHSELQRGDIRTNLMINSSIKNYDNEIEEFLRWIKPFCEYSDSEDTVGYYRYESFEDATEIKMSDW